MASILAFGWMIAAAVAGMTPTPWHRPIAYTLMLVFIPVGWMLTQEYGMWSAFGFFLIAVFQLRLLLISWTKRLLRRFGLQNGK